MLISPTTTSSYPKIPIPFPAFTLSPDTEVTFPAIFPVLLIEPIFICAFTVYNPIPFPLLLLFPIILLASPVIFPLFVNLVNDILLKFVQIPIPFPTFP